MPNFGALGQAPEVDPRRWLDSSRGRRLVRVSDGLVSMGDGFTQLARDRRGGEGGENFLCGYDRKESLRDGGFTNVHRLSF